MKAETREALLAAIAKARGWIDDIRLGRIGSFAEIAEREVQGERHVRLLAPLAFLSPRIIAAIVDGTAPMDLTVTGLARALPYSWGEILAAGRCRLQLRALARLTEAREPMRAALGMDVKRERRVMRRPQGFLRNNS
jgi:hypothetical protein